MARIYTCNAAQKKLAASGAAKPGHGGFIVVPPETTRKNNVLKAEMVDTTTVELQFTGFRYRP